ncbi:uncharacterized protein LOC126981188 isoform X14 [Eriocheir sinensis]|uniref:uncharacterized protein LOC126981188 isoform X9 n=1 Tax=Eriocheir sinensis TaxID=95602 RepID=UPI0021C6A276|nr:uncharacterized protein LOC126981188 isoform X9 [Eriocheir sinensis]XP_050687880.1 uncharacterized protein LOC126981188 isoform X10 [Eriocheir sinensis]XP_050687881.1 uncharacterized protein LOC126981188 isoform X11 [Eriocheir sinensis]XP_050687882.1 uncharacterized protein LOC126981188 isoform X12 [Eriocheir sinensis]XP_050687883.1 uncharacterized protein LOC126981188 isoform X13 [Eriocheir sinensis]XP_050687884.1 uncharacterized protein LOC126981188 isoform X14 [Eriocheir sinensis]
MWLQEAHKIAQYKKKILGKAYSAPPQPPPVPINFIKLSLTGTPDQEANTRCGSPPDVIHPVQEGGTHSGTPDQEANTRCGSPPDVIHPVQEGGTHSGTPDQEANTRCGSPPDVIHPVQEGGTHSGTPDQEANTRCGSPPDVIHPVQEGGTHSGTPDQEANTRCGSPPDVIHPVQEGGTHSGTPDQEANTRCGSPPDVIHPVQEGGTHSETSIQRAEPGNSFEESEVISEIPATGWTESKNVVRTSTPDIPSASELHQLQFQVRKLQEEIDALSAENIKLRNADESGKKNLKKYFSTSQVQYIYVRWETSNPVDC